MADERMGVPEQEARNIWAWTELFRTFQVALDPKNSCSPAPASSSCGWVG